MLSTQLLISHELTDPAKVRELLQPASGGAISFYRVGKRVGNARNDGPGLIEPDLSEVSTDAV